MSLCKGRSGQLTSCVVVPIENSAREGIKLLKNGILKIYPGAPHALPQIQRE